MRRFRLPSSLRRERYEQSCELHQRPHCVQLRREGCHSGNGVRIRTMRRFQVVSDEQVQERHLLLHGLHPSLAARPIPDEEQCVCSFWVLCERYIYKLDSFMKEYSRLVNTRTMLGWNPVTKDFKNISFLLSFCFCSIHASWFLAVIVPIHGSAAPPLFISPSPSFLHGNEE